VPEDSTCKETKHVLPHSRYPGSGAGRPKIQEESKHVNGKTISRIASVLDGVEIMQLTGWPAGRMKPHHTYWPSKFLVGIGGNAFNGWAIQTIISGMIAMESKPWGTTDITDALTEVETEIEVVDTSDSD
jgi:hypothetical protein